MATWREMADEVPDFAADVAQRFAARKHATLATLRKDGSPRISGTEVELDGDEVWLGSMPGALKALDLRRDPRVALHSPTVDPSDDDPSAWPGEAKIAGRAIEVHGGLPDGAHRFRIDITEVVLTRVGRPADHLLIRSWHPGRGLEERHR
ncbi:MAG: pyridoxamine 5'-phosphate oxidase family protein [Actinomycetota bacterium]|nr:pyridoxamine 5'-phosphate oxidase family protein [Actinomycetota bacterium]